MNNLIIGAYNRILSFIEGPRKTKAKYELKYWKSRKAIEGSLSNTHFEHFFITHFALDQAFLNGKKILDIGCGPRGSLEWADMASQRIGLDPLANSYREIGTGAHRMQYVTARAQRIPFPDGYFDVVSCFNSLDHVDDLEQSISEIIRVIAPGGLFLLLTDVHRDPAYTEPAVFSWNVVEEFVPSLGLVEEKHYEKSADGMYQSIEANIPYDHSQRSPR